mgnify:CR=1 FL=1
MTPGGALAVTPDLTFDTLTVLNALAAVCALLGVYQLVVGLGKYTNLVLGLVVCS